MQSNNIQATKTINNISNESTHTESLPSYSSWFRVKITGVWSGIKSKTRFVVSKISSAIRNLTPSNHYEYIPPRDESRLYVANELPYELEPVLSYLSRGQNGFVIEDDEGEARSLIINLDIWDCTKVMVVLMSLNTIVLLLLLIARSTYPGLYEDFEKQFVF